MARPVAVLERAGLIGVVVLLIAYAMFWSIFVRPANALDPLLKEIAADTDQAYKLQIELEEVARSGCDPPVRASTIDPSVSVINAMVMVNASRRNLLAVHESSATWSVASWFPRLNVYRVRIERARNVLSALESNLTIARASAEVARVVCARIR